MLILESFFINSLITIVICSLIIILTNKSNMRKSFLPVLVYLPGFIILIRLINLQIFQKYDKLSIKNSLKQNIYPERFIFDRNGKLLVSNQPMYDLMVIPNSLKSLIQLNYQTLLDKMEKIYENLIRAKKYGAPSVLINQIPKINIQGYKKNVEIL